MVLVLLVIINLMISTRRSDGAKGTVLGAERYRDRAIYTELRQEEEIT
jgi:hypothetical protein